MAQYNKFVDVTFTSTGVAKQLNFPFLPSQIEMWNKTKWGTASNNLVKYAISWAEDAPGTAYALVNAGGSSSGAQLSNKTNQSVAVVTTPGTGAVTFDTNTVLGAGFTHTVGTAGLTVLNAGTYKFLFDVSGTEPNQFQIFVNNVGVPGTTFGSGAGTQQNTGFGLITLAANDVVTLVNSVSAAAVTLAGATPIGGTNVDNSNASLNLALQSGGANDTAVLTSGGFTFFSAGTYQYGPIFTITGIVAATGVVTTSAAHGYAVGDVVLLYGTTGMLQIAGTSTTITAVPSSTTFTIGNIPTSGFAAAATAGFVKKVIFADLYVPFSDIITGITLGATTVITLSVNHRFVVGQEVQIVIPTTPYVNTTSVWGTYQLDSDYVMKTTLIPQQAYVTAISANSITVNINSTGFGAFTYPTSAQAATGVNFPQVLAIGDQNFGGTLIPPLPIVPPAITIPGAWFANTRQGVIVGIGDGTNLMHQTGDIIRVRASFPDGLYLNV